MFELILLYAPIVLVSFITGTALLIILLRMTPDFAFTTQAPKFCLAILMLGWGFGLANLLFSFPPTVSASVLSVGLGFMAVGTISFTMTIWD